VISADDVARVLRYETLIPAMAQALIDFSAGRVVHPVRLIVAAPDGFLGVMPAVYDGIMGAKLVTVFPGNAAHGIPGHQAVIQLFDATTGTPAGTLDGRIITEMRTAAVSAVAVDNLAPRDAHVLAILGSGVQARAHIRAIRTVRPIHEIRIWSRTPEHAERLATEVGGIATTAQTAVQGADIVVAATHAIEPVLHGAWLRERTVVAAVGAIGATHRELDDEAMRGPIIVDSREAAAREAGDLLLADAKVYAELGEILAGTIPRPTGGPIVFKSLGLAVEDLAAARLVMAAL
jgi:ornithine cyclodeaminase/alanine dehydrogenase-like protein (mu-crystallin family)